MNNSTIFSEKKNVATSRKLMKKTGQKQLSVLGSISGPFA